MAQPPTNATIVKLLEDIQQQLAAVLAELRGRTSQQRPLAAVRRPQSQRSPMSSSAGAGPTCC